MEDVAGLFDRLCGCLKTQEEIIDRLIAAGEAQLRAVKGNNINALNETVKEQETLASEMDITEKRRFSLQESLEKALNIERGATLSRLLPFAPGFIKENLQQLFVNLRKKMESFGEINSLNAALIKKAMLVNGRLLQIINSGTSKTYGVNGEIESKSRPRSVLNKSV